VARLLTILRGEPWVEVNHIRPSCLDGRVTLNGEVESDAEREAVEVAARSVAGVRAVVNQLAIKPGIADE
jgi:osmotically-inducible protein OsmY